jgi:hypothetical protein
MIGRSRLSGYALAGLVLIGGVFCFSPRGSWSRPFTYEELIDGIVPGPAADRRIELRQCVNGWKPWASIRDVLFKTMARRGVLGGPQAVLLEVGNPTWSRYGYALAVDGVIEPGLLRARQGAGAREGRIRVAEVQDLRSYLAPNVDDGTCWFLTVVYNGRLVQVARYGVLDDSSGAADVIRQMNAYLQEPAHE